MIKNLLKFLFLFLCLETFSRENLRGLLITNNPTEKVTESSPWARSYLKKICETEHSRSPCPQQLLDYLHQAPQEEINFFKAALQKELYSSMQKSTAKTISFCEDPPEELREKVSQEQRILTLNEALQKSIFCSSYILIKVV